ncbi:hypothetical protein HRbin40_01012 [bacterium HR40]|nr:hypothetical protein HRbin40_01012 [bacterium HR40]
MVRHGRIDYPTLVEDALRGVVREVLTRLARGEIGAPHHYYITFRTGAPGVVMPDYLRARYPHEITIVLQYQFWDLEVDEDSFSVTLSFNDVLERLTVPFRAVRIFADPAVEFGLQFSVPESAVETVRVPITSTSGRGAVEGGTAAAAPAAEEEAGEPAPGEPEEGGKVVTLDRFRRK